MASKEDVEALKRRHRRRLLRLSGVSGVGVERGDGEEAYVLVVHVENDDEETRAAVLKTIGRPDAVRIVRSGPFRKQ